MKKGTRVRSGVRVLRSVARGTGTGEADREGDRIEMVVAEAIRVCHSRQTDPSGATPSPFLGARHLSERRTFAAAEKTVNEAIRLTFTMVSKAGPDIIETVLGDFYGAVLSWVEGMRRDKVDVGAFLTRLRKSDRGSVYSASQRRAPGNA